MKIIAFFPGAYPNGFSPMSHRLHYYMKALKSKGVEVEIVIPCDKNHPSGVYEEIPYSFVGATSRNRFNGIKVANEYSMIFKSLAKKCDAIFTINMGNLFLKKISKAVHNSGGKLILEINENPYSILGSRSETRIGLKIKRFIFLNNTIKHVDGIIVISKALLNLVSIHKAAKTEVIQIPILTGYKEITRHRTYNNKPYILHAGALSEQKDGIKAMLKAFALAYKKLDGNLKLVFTNKIALPSLLKWIDRFLRKAELLDAVEFKGILPKEDLDELYDNCSLAIVNKPTNAQNDYNFPTKLTELLPRRIPIIMSKTGEINRFFQDKVNAFLVEPNNVEQIADRIIYIIKNHEEVDRITENGRILADDNFFYMNHADVLKLFFEKSIN